MTEKRRRTEHDISVIRSVIKKKRAYYIEQKYIPPPLDGIVPDGCFVFQNGRIHCPKKRGESLFVTYESIFYEEI